MWKKILLAFALFLGLIGWYGFVFGWNLVFNPDIKYVGTSSQRVYLDDSELATTILVYQSNIDISQYTVVSSCKIKSQFLESYKSLYFFELDYSSDVQCKNGNIVLQAGTEKIISTITKLELENTLSEMKKFIDYSPADLQNFANAIQAEQKKYSIYKNYKNAA